MKQASVRRVLGLSPGQMALWAASAGAAVAGAFFWGTDALNLTASLIGVTALIFLAIGSVMGQALILVFGILYGIISYECAYYGETITYVGMTGPMAAMALISWIRHPYRGDEKVVKIARLTGRVVLRMLALTAIVTAVSYPLLKWFGTANLLFSTLSVATSFAAAYLTYRRTAAYALAYALNDIVLIVLWVLAARDDLTYVSMVICFSAFLVNDLYGFANWKKMQALQEAGA